MTDKKLQLGFMFIAGLITGIMINNAYTKHKERVKIEKFLEDKNKNQK